jgi:hypothetical protein
MDNEKWARGAAVFSSCYIKRWLEGRYDQLGDLPAVAKLKALSTGTKLGIEAILYTLTAYAEQKLTDQSPLGLMAKTVLMDAAPEIASRLMTDVRADLTGATTGEVALDEPRQAVASKLLALQNKELLGILVSMEEMDDATRGKFLSFAASSSGEELAKFSALTQEQRKMLLSAQGIGQGPSTGGWAAALKTFSKDFWVVFKAWSQKTHEVAIPVLNRYMLALLWVLKTSAVLWAMAFVACTASALFGRWLLFVILLVLTGVSVFGIRWSRGNDKSWLAAASMVTAGVMALLALLTVAGYADSVFGVAVLFLVGVPTLAIGALLIPVTMAFEILRSLFPDGYRTLMSAAQMLLCAFFGILFFAVILLVFPPQNPVAFLFVVPITIALAWGVGFGLVRTNPAMFLRTPVLLGIGFVFLVTVGMMSMPNLRSKLRTLPKSVDSAFVAAPKPVDFVSSKEIDFVTVDGEVKIWYAERVEGGYDLFRCEGYGPYYAPDGRRLMKADNDAIRVKISNWVDHATMQHAESERKAEQERGAREHEKRSAAKQQQEEETARAEKARRESYLITATLPAKVNYIVCAATITKKPLDDFASGLAKQLKDNGVPASSAVFAPAFATEGGFDNFYSGKGVLDIKAMPLAGMGGKLLLVRCDESATKASATVPGLFNASVKMSLRILDASDGKILDEFHLTGIGPGTGEKAAEAAAFERILEQVREHKFE